MKKFMKYAVGTLALALSLVMVSAAHAAPMWGVGGNPYLPLVQVQDCSPTGYGCSSSVTAYSPSISGVNPGDNVWVMVYYNNQGTGTANNARITLSPQSTGSVSSQTFMGTLTADNTTQVSGSASVGLTSAQSLSFLSAKLYAHGGVQIALPNGQSGSELFSGGLNIGNIHDPSDCSSSDTFCHQGVLVVTFKVGTAVVPPPPPPPQQCQITQFSANPTFVSSGSSSTLVWSTTGCTSATVSGGNVYASGLSSSTSTSQLYNTTTFTLTAYGSSGVPVSQTVTVSVNQVPPPQQTCYINYFNANPTFVTYGGTSTLTWSTTGCTSATLSGPSIYNANQSVSGSYPTGPIYGSSTYTLYAYGTNGAQQQQTVTVTTQQQTICSVGSFYASPSTVTSGQSTTLYWNTTGATSVYISGLTNYYNQSLSGSATTGAIYGSQIYTLTANCQNGVNQTQTVTVTTSQPVQNLAVYTGPPTIITTTSARLNGILTSANNQAQVYFQWATNSSAIGSTTNQQTVTSGTSFVSTLTGLASNTTYYYRAVATDSTGTVYGSVESFSTQPATVYVPPTVITQVIGTGSGSDLVSLDINNNQQVNACVGNIVTYVVNYKNISGHTLNNAVLQVILPQDVDFQSSNPGIYNASDHTVTLAIGTLIRDQQGSMTVTVLVSRSAVNRNLIVATATLAFTNPVNNSQESATAYGLGGTTNCAANSLAGLALFGNGFWPTTLIGWLILILVLLLLIYLAVTLYRNSRRHTYVYGPTAAGRPTGPTMSSTNNTNGAHYEDMDVPTYSNH